MKLSMPINFYVVIKNRVIQLVRIDADARRKS